MDRNCTLSIGLITDCPFALLHWVCDILYIIVIIKKYHPDFKFYFIICVLLVVIVGITGLIFVYVYIFMTTSHYLSIFCCILHITHIIQYNSIVVVGRLVERLLALPLKM